ncbi:zinc-binding metallopeptidase family protein [Aquisphaera insulae]|uniref:zinc-binding metallopeptidase family protein n=1 Tax=Aquisphaera insulae TaxID=2712864 RepID=UPI0013EB83D3|nr:putative zinc-binding metallopeptidase [Aquisphaera insulae]
MKVFHCGQCDHLIFFENFACTNCGHTLAFLPDRIEMVALEPAGGTEWRALGKGNEGSTYRLCQNYTNDNVCNWAIPADDPEPFCRSCRLDRVIPNLSQPGTVEAWAKLEASKRRLLYTLLYLGLPVPTKAEEPEKGLAFDFLADPPKGSDEPKVLTGHADGVITINIAEANDAEREKRRLNMHEPYRTLVGHFRHEVGHYYWDLLIKDSAQLEEFRRLFGDDREDYAEALNKHYEAGPRPDWPQRFISAYASTHPWEDWAESWAHYLHMTATMDSAIRSGVSLQPGRDDEPTWKPKAAGAGYQDFTFDELMEGWFALTYIMNNLNRCMGIQDAYPFVLAPPILEKLRFVHMVVRLSAEVGRQTGTVQGVKVEPVAV